MAEIRIIAAFAAAIGAIFIWQLRYSQDRSIRRIRQARLEELREPSHLSQRVGMDRHRTFPVITSPAEMRAAARRGEWRGSTGGRQCPAYQQANLIILPKGGGCRVCCFLHPQPQALPAHRDHAPGAAFSRYQRSRTGSDCRCDRQCPRRCSGVRIRELPLTAERVKAAIGV